MKVSELIEALQKFDADLEVAIDADHGQIPMIGGIPKEAYVEDKSQYLME